MYVLVRAPRRILDHALTLLLAHVVLTTYYAAALPSSLFFWAVVLAGTALTVAGAEQLCVRREMREGLRTGGHAQPEVEEMEMGARALRRD